MLFRHDVGFDVRRSMVLWKLNNFGCALEDEGDIKGAVLESRNAATKGYPSAIKTDQGSSTLLQQAMMKPICGCKLLRVVDRRKLS